MPEQEKRVNGVYELWRAQGKLLEALREAKCDCYARHSQEIELDNHFSDCAYRKIIEECI